MAGPFPSASRPYPKTRCRSDRGRSIPPSTGWNGRAGSEHAGRRPKTTAGQSITNSPRRAVDNWRRKPGPGAVSPQSLTEFSTRFSVRPMLHDFRFRMRSFFRRRRAETDLDDELQFHLAKEAEKYEAAGMSRELAVRRARLSLGGLDL